jgi:hypothetical protein
MQNFKMQQLKRISLCGVLIFTLLAGTLKPSYALFDKTRFVLHLGAAFFAFHHFVYNPYKAGAFQSGAPHRTKALVKGGLALLFAVHEVKVANEIAHKSNSPLLHKVANSLDAMQSSFASVGQKLKGGHFDPSDADSVNDVVNSVGAGALAAGIPIKDRAIPIPGT